MYPLIMPVFLEVRKYFERAPYFFLALLTSKYSGVNFRIEFCRRSWWKIRGSLHQDDSGRDQPGGAQIVRALVQLHREVLGHVPGDVEGIHPGGQTGDHEDGAAGEMRRRMRCPTTNLSRVMMQERVLTTIIHTVSQNNYTNQYQARCIYM